MTTFDLAEARTRLNKLFPHVSYLKPCIDGVLVSSNPVFIETNTSFRSNAELNTVHPHFAMALHLCGFNDPVFRTSHMLSILDLWHIEIFVETSEDYLVGITFVKNLVVSGDHLYLFAGAYSYAEASDILTRTKLKIPYAPYPKNIRIETAWLDEFYPNWRQRLEVAEGLDLDKTECLRSVLTDIGAVSAIALPDVTFRL